MGQAKNHVWLFQKNLQKKKKEAAYKNLAKGLYNNLEG